MLEQATPDLVVVQGDTPSALAGALAATMRAIPLAQIEAGLRRFPAAFTDPALGGSEGRVVLFGDFFAVPAALQGGFWPGLEKLHALRDKATKVYDSDWAGATYVPPAPRG